LEFTQIYKTMEIGFYIQGKQWQKSKYGKNPMSVVKAIAKGIPKNISHSYIILNGAKGKREKAFRPQKPYDIAITWSIYKQAKPATFFKQRVHDFQKKQNKKILILERGFVKREQYYSIGYNHQNGHADFKNELMPPDRWNKIEKEIKPYRSKGEHILLCGQLPSDTSVQDIDYNNWLRDIVKEITKYTDRPIIFREHPQLRPKHRIHLEGVFYSNNKYLEQDFKNCWAVVSYNSNSLVEAALAGIPGFAFNKGSMAWTVSNRDLSNLENPNLSFDRNQWAYNLAYTQWTREEMEEGKAWSHLL
tara:strand:- start:11795 stop:12706 length:912 start_codon:yes stop_codon:yes gene_type:complete